MSFHAGPSIFLRLRQAPFFLPDLARGTRSCPLCGGVPLFVENIERLIPRKSSPLKEGGLPCAGGKKLLEQRGPRGCRGLFFP